MEGNTQQVVDYKKTAEEVTQVPATGHKFLGWEMTNSQGTSLCEDPAQVEITENPSKDNINKKNDKINSNNKDKNNTNDDNGTS